MTAYQGRMKYWETPAGLSAGITDWNALVHIHVFSAITVRQAKGAG
jgi:hypothetical protein